jgi:NAD(P)-dependent dehydrogenase (short-subunit alcohol dehydrogenase family)
MIFSVNKYNVIVTGGSRGIGLALAEGFSSAGANVIILDINPPEVEGNYNYINCDLGNQDNIQVVLDRIFSDGFIPKVLINCAAVTIPAPSHQYSDSDWRRSISVNLDGVFTLCREVGRIMINSSISGSIINFTSIGAEQGFANNPGYAATKGAVKQLTKALAVEWGEYGIRVNNIVPGYTNTPMNSKSWNDPLLKKQRSDHTVFGRWAEPAEMVGPAIFLASDASSYVTGIDLVVDGGWLVKGM